MWTAPVGQESDRPDTGFFAAFLLDAAEARGDATFVHTVHHGPVTYRQLAEAAGGVAVQLLEGGLLRTYQQQPTGGSRS
jgi:hypothetical protein